MIRFQHPEYLWWLSALPLLVLALVLLMMWRSRRLKKMGDSPVTTAQFLGRIPGRLALKAVLLLSALMLIVVGAANLQGGGHPEQVQRKGVDVMIALDVSNSMYAQDLQPNRLTRAKQFIERVLDKLRNDRVGLIIFAGRAYLQAPLTVDYASVQLMLQNASPAMAPTQGTVIGDAIEMAMKSFSQKERNHKTLIIISDGEDHDEKAAAAAKEAADQGIIIHTIGVGSEQGAPLFNEDSHTPKLDENGQQVISKLNQDELRNLAEIGGGSYQLLGNAEDAASRLVGRIDQMEGRNMGSIAYVDFQSYFQFFLLPALLLLIIERLIPGARPIRLWKTA
ncbi:MAG: VWA domain-containing protein [Bacteroidetes bacterium]|nr:VWA domain-containing protein [Bacteroidota bacterium]MBS1630479.1 VWA domain-containing protein [Bacteroidota bacterium]